MEKKAERQKRSAFSFSAARKSFIRFGAGGETRTLMSVTSPDFESGAYTNFATPAKAGARQY
jgi:hypothetical protein